MQASTGAAWNYNLAGAGAGSENGVTGEAGLNFDSRVGAYDGIPIFLSQHVASESDATARIYLLDMDNLAFRVAAPTTYVDNTNLAVRQALSREYAFITAGELIPILGGGLLAGYVIAKATCSTGAGETPAILKMRAFLRSSKVQRTLSSKRKSAQKLLVGGLRLTSDLLSVGADLLSPKANPKKK